MANVVVTIKIMPESPEISLDDLENKIKEKVNSTFGNVAFKSSREPVAFGLSSLNVAFVMSESDSCDEIINQIKEIDGVNSAEMIDIRRAIG